MEGGEYEKLIKANIIIVEGLYSLAPHIYELGDICIYIDASPLDRAKGRIWRDIIVRKRDERHVVEMLMGRETYHQTFVEPTQMIADYILRRPETGGSLQVVYEEEIEECFRKSCISWVFCEQDLKNPIEFVKKINKSTDSVSSRIRGFFTEEFRELLKKIDDLDKDYNNRYRRHSHSGRWTSARG